MNSKECGRKRQWNFLKYYPEIRHEGAEENRKYP
jgi:hypothetical protein